MAVFRHTQFVNVVKIQHLQLTRVETCFCLRMVLPDASINIQIHGWVSGGTATSGWLWGKGVTFQPRIMCVNLYYIILYFILLYYVFLILFYICCIIFIIYYIRLDYIIFFYTYINIQCAPPSCRLPNPIDYRHFIPPNLDLWLVNG